MKTNISLLFNVFVFSLPLDTLSSDPWPASIDYVLINITSDKNQLYTLCCVYIPPTQAVSTYKTLFKYLQFNLTSSDIEAFYLFGDFNLPLLEWQGPDDLNRMHPILNDNLGISEICILNLCSITSCYQFNAFKNNSNRTLDLCLSNSIINSCVLPSQPLVPLDCIHPAFVIACNLLLVSKPLPRNNCPKYRFLEANYANINNDISKFDWSLTLSPLSSLDAIHRFYEHLYEIIGRHVPLRNSKPSEFPVWFSRPLAHIFRDKNKAWIRWRKYNNISDYEAFSLYRKRFKDLSKVCFDSYINKIENNLRDDVRVFWNFVHSFKGKNRIPDQMYFGNQNSNEPEGICNLFLDFFGSVYEPGTNYSLDNDCSNISHNPKVNSNITDIVVNRVDVVKVLKSLDVTKGIGLDGIHPFFLKHTAETICIPLAIVYNKCLKEGTFPAIWKAANVAPVLKSGSPNNVENYRPISLLSTLSKVFEKLVHNNIYPILHNTILPQQHGFIKDRSTITNLTIYTDFLFKCMDKRVQVDAIYTDFCKAFDKVDHEMLLKKLQFNGIRGNLLRWFCSYITNRTQKVVINGFGSGSTITVSSGVPQGSILGPLLFVLFINDIDVCFKNCKFLLYADDLKVYRQIETSNDCDALQEDLNRLTDYCCQNKLHLSLSKCKSITITRKINIISHTYSLCNTILESVSVIRDLGLLVDSKLHFDQHIEYIVNRAYKAYGFVFRICGNKFRRANSFIYLFQSLVRAQLEYASVIWNPFYDKYVQELERVQRKFLRTTNFKINRRSLSYDKLLELYSLNTLKSRRLQHDAIFLFRIHKSKFDSTELTESLYYNTPSRSVRIRDNYNFKPFHNDRCFTNAGLRAPSTRITREFNEYFYSTDFTVTEYAFKKQIRLTLSEATNKV